MNTNDIRYIKTHNNINDAVVSLLRQKKFDKIYVKDICDTAKISRGTFYLHYVDKYDLVNQNLQQFITLSTQLINNPKVRTIENLMLLTLNRLKTDGQIAALLLSKNGSPEIQEQCKNFFKQNVRTKILPFLSLELNSELEEDYTVAFLVNGIFGLLQQWVNNGEKEDPAFVVQLMKKWIPYDFK